MSIKNWPGGLINKTPPTPSGPYQNSTAPGVWTLDQQAYWQKQGQWPTAGSVDPSAFIENLFSTWLYTGNGATQTITNGIDLAGKGGLTWIKGRSGVTDHALYDTVRGATFDLVSNSTAAQTTQATGLTAFSSTGFSIGALAKLNTNAATYASWTFREQAKFFDIVTYTGNGTSQNISHNLGATPGCIMVKRTDAAGEWYVWHTGLSSATTSYLFLARTDAATTSTAVWNNTAPTATQFSVGATAATNGSGATYVAYLFAHNAGGFGLTGTDNVISCGSFTATSGGAATVTLGYEPQFLFFKKSDGIGNWAIIDNMRGWSFSNVAELKPNSSAAEDPNAYLANPTATGFNFSSGTLTNSANYIYIAIRRGPMKTPTSGTSVFNTVLETPSASGVKYNAGFPIDLLISGMRAGTGNPQYVEDRLRGVNTTRVDSGSYPYLSTSLTDAEVQQAWGLTQGWDNTGFYNRGILGVNIAAWAFRRAPGFFDEVCYTGTLTTLNVSHNLGAVPQLIITKSRSAIGNWTVQPLSNGTQRLRLNTTAAQTSDAGPWNNTNPTNSVFTLGADTGTNSSGVTYVAYLFATVTGVSKVGSYTGTGSLQTVNCGFAAGARFVLIKRTDAVGDWYVWDSARGITSGNDPYLLLNSGASEVTGTNYVDTTAVGFQVTAAAPAALNAVGGTYIFLAIA